MTTKNIDFLQQRKRKSESPTLRFSPYAWAKLLAFRDYGPTEIAGFGVATGSDPLLIDDFITVKQACTAMTVAMDDDAVADYFDRQVDAGFKPEQFLRVWLHTHPGNSAHPSGTDEETFERVFGRCDWAVMAILARGGQTYARLRFGVGPGGQMLIPIEVDFGVPFKAADHEAWQTEYEQHVTPEPDLLMMRHALGDGAMAAARRPMRKDSSGDLSQEQDWHQDQAWDIHDLNDLEALAHLEAELDAEMQQRGIHEEMEVPFDSY